MFRLLRTTMDLKIAVDRTAQEEPGIDTREEPDGNEEEPEGGRGRLARDDLEEDHRGDEVMRGVGHDNGTRIDPAEERCLVEPIEGRQGKPGRGQELAEPGSRRGKGWNETRQDDVRGEEERQSAQ